MSTTAKTLSVKDAAEAIREELLKNTGKRPEIAKKAGVGLRWLRSFADGAHDNPNMDWVLKVGRVLGVEVHLMLFRPNPLAETGRPAHGRKGRLPREGRRLAGGVSGAS